MELNLTLRIISGNHLPLNYQYELSSWIYKVISRADAGHSAFLHSQGFETEGRHFKMFTFSQLDLRPYKIVGNEIKLLGTEISLNVRFMVDSSLENFIKGLFLQQRFQLGDRYNIIDFEVSGIETVQPPVFHSTMHYACLSPICVSQKRADGTAAYLTPDVIDYGKLLIENLQRKANALVAAGTDNHIIPSGFNFKLLNTPRKKGVHIKANTESHTQVIGYLFHFELTAPAELHEIGYYAGFGEKNSMGFGCVNTQN
jgi:CRISPR-associated endoribonuclease Cas6